MSRRRRAGGSFTCPGCGLEVRLTRNTAVVKKKKSAARVRQGRRLAATLQRDERGRFLPRRGRTRTRAEGPAPRSTRRRIVRSPSRARFSPTREEIEVELFGE